MYQDYFQLSCKPFSVTPDPRFIYLSAKHKEALAHLLYGIEQRSGFIELSGEVGAGKTTLLRTLLRECDTDDYRTAFIFNPRLSALDLLRTVNREFGLECDGSRSELFHLLNRFLLEQNAAGRTVLIVVDEAQNLKTTALEEIRLLSNLETETDKLVQIILVGQPELRRLLEHADIRQLNQRIAVRYHLNPLDAAETGRYIRHRLQVAGAGGQEFFKPAAMKKIFRRTGGVPRQINLLCDRLLLLCYSEDRRVVTGADVSRACRELEHERRFGRTLFFQGAVAVCLALVFALSFRVVPQMRHGWSLPTE
nr:AAA family ATPase [Desulfuromonadales bacterium]